MFDAKKVSDKESFLKFVASLEMDLRDNADAWENSTLPSFLSAMHSWTEDWNFEHPLNPWTLAASLLAAARIYE